MKRLRPCWPVLLALYLPAAQAQLVWQPVPAASDSHGGHGGHGKRAAGKPFELQGIVDGQPSVALYQPDLSSTVLPLEGAQVAVKSTGVNNYHALVARQTSATTESVAIRYVYLNGKPSGHSPSELLAEPLARLEIVPAPLPREHRRYETRKPYRFEVRFDQQLMSQQPITLSTQGGTRLDLLTDEQGVLTLTLPEDFAEIKPGRRNNRPLEWQLTTYIQDRGVLYNASLSAPYHPSPANWQSYGLGLAVAALGFGVGLGVNRRLPVQSRRKSK